MSDGKITVDLKQREVEVLAAYVASLKSKPDSSQVDMAKFMQASGYTTLASAQVNLGKVLRKVFKGEGGGEGTPPKKAGGRKRKVVDGDGDDDEDTPAKKTTKIKAKKNEHAEAEDGKDVKNVKSETAEDDF